MSTSKYHKVLPQLPWQAQMRQFLDLDNMSNTLDISEAHFNIPIWWLENLNLFIELNKGTIDDLFMGYKAVGVAFRGKLSARGVTSRQNRDKFANLVRKLITLHTGTNGGVFQPPIWKPKGPAPVRRSTTTGPQTVPLPPPLPPRPAPQPPTHVCAPCSSCPTLATELASLKTELARLQTLLAAQVAPPVQPTPTPRAHLTRVLPVASLLDGLQPYLLTWAQGLSNATSDLLTDACLTNHDIAPFSLNHCVVSDPVSFRLNNVVRVITPTAVCPKADYADWSYSLCLVGGGAALIMIKHTEFLADVGFTTFRHRLPELDWTW
jgi:hypothetical protein